MKERVWGCMAALLLTLAMSVSFLAGCAGKTAEDEEEPIQVYLWTANLYESRMALFITRGVIPLPLGMGI